MKESFRHFEHKKVDLIGLGNAIVDIIVNIEDEFLEINNLDKGSMNLINSDESQRLLENCKVIKQISGGSSANTVVSLAELGNHCLLYTSPSPRDQVVSRMPSSA